ncbi:MAG: glycosyltransferase, partial [Candidatus Pacebacteria bacterium]|nr:glycosyltransferase [Candidatus Paceibacterota bacterium]
MKKIKVLEIEPVSDLGGVSQFISRLVEYLPKDDFEMHFGASGNGEIIGILEKKGVICHTVDINYSALHLFSAARSLRKLLVEEHIDIMHAHTAKAGIVAAFATRRIPITFVFSGHGWLFLTIPNPFERFFFYLLERYVVRRAKSVTYLSHIESEQGNRMI